MNPVIVELKLSTDSKERACKIITAMQQVMNGCRDATVGIQLHVLLEGHAIMVEASYRERRDNE